MTETVKTFDSYLKTYGEPAHIKSRSQYEDLYRRSCEEPDSFWAEQARKYLSWEKEWDLVLRYDFDEAEIEWFGGGVLNASYNCLDRHMDRLADRVAYHWEGIDPNDSKSVTYGELFRLVNRFAGVLKSKGIGRGDGVMMLMPLIPELPVAMLACARIGAVHCVVYPGHGVTALAYRMRDFKPRMVITADRAVLADKEVRPEALVAEAISLSQAPETVLVCKRSGEGPHDKGDRDIWWHEAMEQPGLPEFVQPEPMAASDPLFVLYTSGARGAPKGVVHNHGGYLLYTAMTTSLVFDLRDHDKLMTTAEPGGITGTSYGVYGPLLNGVTSVLFEGATPPSGSDRVWEIVAKHRVDILYTTPTDVRIWARKGRVPAKQYDLSSLRLLACSGEPMAPDTWEWFYTNVGAERCPIVDTWWQAETGGHGIVQLPGLGPLRAGACGLPFFGVAPVVLDPDTGEETKYPNQEGVLCIRLPWPGMICTIHGDHERFLETYFSRVPGLYFTGDGAKRDEDGLFWVSGRIDDVVIPAGFRLGTWEIETTLVKHDLVAEAAVVGYPHPIKGQGVYAFITPAKGALTSNAVKAELVSFVQEQIGSFAVLDVIQWSNKLPKTRSGKTLRRLLQIIAAAHLDDLGDFAGMADPALVEKLVADRFKLAAAP